MSEQGDLFGAVASKHEALERVERHAGPWFEHALDYIARLPDWMGTGEDMRWLVTKALGKPHHHNAWGALIGQAVKRNMLAKTGERRKMRGPKNNARETAVYRKI